jgi:uncharacterized protein YbjT (DUF2867 family)
MKIIVTGSLGHIGKPVTEELVQKGHSVVVISSKPERKKEIEALGAIAAIGLVDNIDFLTSTFNGADVVYGMVPPNNTVPDPTARNRKVGENIAEAIGRSGVKRVVYVRSYGAEQEKGTGLIAGHYHIEKALNKLPGVEAITHLRATYIYYNLLVFVNMIKRLGYMAANYGGDDRLVMVSPIDIAASVVEEIEIQTTGKKVKYIASDVRSCNEIARILGRAIGKPDLKWIVITNEEMQKGLEANGVSSSVAAVLVEMFGAIHSNLLHQDYDRHTGPMGKVKIEDFAKEFAAAFNQ